MEAKKTKILDKIQSNNVSKNLLFEEISSLSKEIDKLTIETDFLENYDKFFNEEDNYKKTLEFTKLQSKYNKTKFGLRSPEGKSASKNSDSDKAAQIHAQFVQANEMRNEELNSKKQELKMKLNLRNSLINKLNLIKTVIKKDKEELEKIKKVLSKYYHKLLQEGTDTRMEGLVWIITAIWNLNKEVDPEYLPLFLDEKSLVFLFEYASYNIQKQNIRKQLNKLKESYKSLNLKYENKLFKTSDSYESSKFLKFMKRNNNRKLSLNLKKLEKEMENKDEIDPEIYNFIEKIKSLDREFMNIKIQVDKLKNSELARINREYLLKDYEKRFNKPMKDVLSCLIGKENANIENSKLMREQKDILKKLKACKTFNFLEPEQKKNRLKSFQRFQNILLQIKTKNIKSKKNEFLLKSGHEEQNVVEEEKVEEEEESDNIF